MDKEYELIQNGEQVAATSGVNAFNEIKHYAWQCEHCGPVEVFEVTRRKIDLSAAPQVVAEERKKQDGIEAAELQTLLISEFECYRPTHPAGLMVWARMALLDCSPHRATPVQAQQPVAWMTEDGRVSTDETKRTAMASTSRPVFNIPLFRGPVPAQEPRKPTDISQRLRKWADERAIAAHYGDLMRTAADEIERYYGGMMAWKQTAEKKDADWNAERMARVDDRIANRNSAPAQAQEPVECKTCDGTGIVSDGEINAYPDGTPYMNGPVKCVKDCPDCAKATTPVQPVAVPDGWKLVPVEPDCMMAHAVLLDSRSNDSYLGSEPRELWIADRVYRTMLAAAPAAPAAQGDSTEPKLPSIPLAKMLTGKDSESLQVWYSKEQMQEYARAAIAAKAAS